MDQRLCAGTAALVVGNEGAVGQVLLLGDRLDKACDLVGTPTGASHDDEVNGFARLPILRQSLNRCGRKQRSADNSEKRAFGKFHFKYSLFRLEQPRNRATTTEADHLK